MKKVNANDKCIVLARVSTIYQDYTEQVNELKQAAIADGFSADNIITITDKESATKLSEENRLGLTEMKQAITNDREITTVYVREVSRIGRRYDVLVSMKAFLIKTNTQLIVCGDTRRELLDDNGNISLVGNLLFEIECGRAIEEVKEKNLRTRQGRLRAQAEGRLGCASPAYGYTIKNGRLAINEEQAEVVRWIFDTYVNDNASTYTLYKDLRDRGIWTETKSREIGARRVQVMIHSLSYSGRNTKYQYPAIVSAELQDAAISKAQHARQYEKVEHKHTYYASGLMRCECGHRMHAEIAYTSYRCPHCNRGISINQLDHVAWNEAQVIKTLQMKQDKRVTTAEAEKQLKDNNQRMAAAEKRLAELEDKTVSVIDLALNIASKEKRDAFTAAKMEAIKGEQQELNNTIAKLKQDNDRLNNILNPTDDKLSDAMFVSGISDDKQRKKIINEVIESIRIERIDENRVKFVVTPTVAAWGWRYPELQQTADSITTEWVRQPYTTHYVYDRTKKTRPSLYRVTGQTVEDMTKQIVRRFESYATRKKRKEVG